MDADIVSAFAGSFAVGYEPPRSLAAQDEALFRAFQSNLLSLISHELRTPLTGILNALMILDENAEGGPKGSDVPRAELIRMARQNAQRLHRTLLTLLDLATIDSGTFHVRLREVDLGRLLADRIENHKSLLGDKALRLFGADFPEGVALADSHKFTRVIDLCLQTVVFRALHGSDVEVRISSTPSPVVSFRFQLEADGIEPWGRAWIHGSAGFESGVGSPASAFAGVLQSEDAFLTRTEEGLGTEFLLIHEAMRLHHGKFEQEREGDRVTLFLKLPDFSSDEALKVVLSSRAYENTIRATSVGLVLIEVPEAWRTPEKVSEFCAQIKGILFRTTDSTYPLPNRNQIAVVTDEISRDGTHALFERIRDKLLPEVGPLKAGIAQCPADATDPTQLLQIAEERLR